MVAICPRKIQGVSNSFTNSKYYKNGVTLPLKGAVNIERKKRLAYSRVKRLYSNGQKLDRKQCYNDH